MRKLSLMFSLFFVNSAESDFEISYSHALEGNWPSIAETMNITEPSTILPFERCVNPLLDDGPYNEPIFEYTSVNPLGPIVECHLLSDEFIKCALPTPLYGPGQTGQIPTNASYKNEGKCVKMGGYRAEDIEFTNVKCHVLPCIECHGKRVFLKLTPCIIYSGHYFLTTLLQSIFLGVVAVDRFCLGYSAMAVGKLMTLGGFGVWWIVDIFLLVTGSLGPADDSNWEPYF